MFNLFKKKKTVETLVSPVDGELINIEKVPDPMFAQKVMGDGFGVNPTNDYIYSPVGGTITSIFPTKHAVSFTTDNGLEVLLHIGIDTVELNGEPFEFIVKDGDHVELGQKIGAFNRSAIKASGKQDTVIVIITNMDKVEGMSDISERTIHNGETVTESTLK